MRTGKILFFLLLLANFVATAQTETYMFRVWLADKAQSNYSIEHPNQFLSEKSIERRNRQGIAIDERDLPVNKHYLDQIEALGARIVVTSRWLNTAVVAFDDSTTIMNIEALDFVTKTFCVWEKLSDSRKELKQSSKYDLEATKDTTSTGYYPPQQLQRINLDRLHAEGYTGAGMTIAITDGGFLDADRYASIPTDKILGTRNFIDNEFTFRNGSTHGSCVFSVMASHVPNKFMGAAPDADYWLIVTEDDKHELPIEEDYWVAGAEFADSVGADIINISLGYYKYDKPHESYTHRDLNGKTAHISIAAEIASQKGLLVVAAAGNEFISTWEKIAFPADAAGILTVGGIDAYDQHSFFSSVGFTADGRVKPDVVARGTSTAMLDTENNIVFNSGTSFAAPIISGAAACLWQAHREWSVEHLIDVIQRSASLYTRPNTYLGYGIPDFYAAHTHLAGMETPSHSTVLYAVGHTLYLADVKLPCTLTLYDTVGRAVWQSLLAQETMSVDLSTLHEGIYIAVINGANSIITQKIILH